MCACSRGPDPPPEPTRLKVFLKNGGCILTTPTFRATGGGGQNQLNEVGRHYFIFTGGENGTFQPRTCRVLVLSGLFVRDQKLQTELEVPSSNCLADLNFSSKREGRVEGGGGGWGGASAWEWLGN